MSVRSEITRIDNEMGRAIRRSEIIENAEIANIVELVISTTTEMLLGLAVARKHTGERVSAEEEDKS